MLFVSKKSNNHENKNQFDSPHSVLYVCSSLYAKVPDLFYYYKGAPVPLSTNTQHFIVYADAEKISKEFFAQEYRVTERIEDGRKGVLEAQVNIPNANYYSVINILRGKEYTIDIEPVIETSAMVNVSNLFYVKLRSSNDYALLKSVASISGTQIKGFKFRKLFSPRLQ